MYHKKHQNRPPSKDQFHGIIEKLLCWLGENPVYLNISAGGPTIGDRMEIIAYHEIAHGFDFLDFELFSRKYFATPGLPVPKGALAGLTRTQIADGDKRLPIMNKDFIGSDSDYEVLPAYMINKIQNDQEP